MKVSVCMITYNHERFVGQAIDSVLAQEADFDYQIVVGEDGSSDSTRSVVAEYQQNYPDRITLLSDEGNLGMMPNFVRTLQACDGEYVAILEGDDYWTDPRKLQKQISYMDTCPECAIACSKVSVVYEEGADNEYGQYWPKPEYEAPAVTSFVDVVTRPRYIPWCSCVFRGEHVRRLPPWFGSMPVGDSPLLALCAQHGYVYYSDEVTAAYRRHPQGVTVDWEWGSWQRNKIKLCRNLLKTVRHEYHSAIRAAIGETAYDLAMGYEERGFDSRARRAAWMRLRAGHRPANLEDPLRHYLRLLVPGLYRAVRALKGQRRGA